MKKLLSIMVLAGMGLNAMAAETSAVPKDKPQEAKPIENTGNVCESLVKRIEMLPRAIASVEYDLNAKSNDQLKVLSYKQDVANYLAIMQQNKCPQSINWVDPVRFASSAMKCGTAMITARGGNVPPECDIKNWKAE